MKLEMGGLDEFVVLEMGTFNADNSCSRLFRWWRQGSVKRFVDVMIGERQSGSLGNLRRGKRQDRYMCIKCRTQLGNWK